MDGWLKGICILAVMFSVLYFLSGKSRENSSDAGKKANDEDKSKTITLFFAFVGMIVFIFIIKAFVLN